MLNFYFVTPHSKSLRGISIYLNPTRHGCHRGPGHAMQRAAAAALVEGVGSCRRYGRLKQVALRSVAASLAADSDALAGLREIFDSLDTTCSGRISHDAMVQVRNRNYWDTWLKQF